MIKLKELLDESFHEGQGWMVYEGSGHITCILECGKEIAFELTFRDKKGEEKNKWRKSAASKWATVAREIYNNPDLNEIGNPRLKSWEQCFQEALTDERIKPFIKETDRMPVFNYS
jgi:hypothetical protein